MTTYAQERPFPSAPAAPRLLRGALLAAPVLVCLGLLVWLLALPGEGRVIAAFSTGFRGRTPSQIHNVRLTLAALDGQVIAPGAEFSFNRVVGPWGPDRGYRRAPVSFSGEKVLDWGGGVCQASTAVYNAALLAGLPIVERHRHHWATTYVPPGQDAAVAYPSIDLRFRNSLSAPIRVSASIVGEAVVIKLHSAAPPTRVRLERQVLGVSPSAVIVRDQGAAHHRTVHGFPGYEVALYRVFVGEGPERRELVSRDSYPPQNQVVYQ
jgi:vancomycin resistance protein VanW